MLHLQFTFWEAKMVHGRATTENEQKEYLAGVLDRLFGRALQNGSPFYRCGYDQEIRIETRRIVDGFGDGAFNLPRKAGGEAYQQGYDRGLAATKRQKELCAQGYADAKTGEAVPLKDDVSYLIGYSYARRELGVRAMYIDIYC